MHVISFCEIYVIDAVGTRGKSGTRIGQYIIGEGRGITTANIAGILVCYINVNVNHIAVFVIVIGHIDIDVTLGVEIPSVAVIVLFATIIVIRREQCAIGIEFCLCITKGIKVYADLVLIFVFFYIVFVVCNKGDHKSYSAVKERFFGIGEFGIEIAGGGITGICAAVLCDYVNININNVFVFVVVKGHIHVNVALGVIVPSVAVGIFVAAFVAIGRKQLAVGIEFCLRVAKGVKIDADFVLVFVFFYIVIVIGNERNDKSHGAVKECLFGTCESGIGMLGVGTTLIAACRLYFYNVYVNRAFIGCHFNGTHVIFDVAARGNGVANLKAGNAVAHVDGVNEHFCLSVGEINVFVIILGFTNCSNRSLYIERLRRAFTLCKISAHLICISGAYGIVQRTVMDLGNRRCRCGIRGCNVRCRGDFLGACRRYFGLGSGNLRQKRLQGQKVTGSQRCQ